MFMQWFISDESLCFFLLWEPVSEMSLVLFRNEALFEIKCRLSLEADIKTLYNFSRSRSSMLVQASISYEMIDIALSETDNRIEVNFALKLCQSSFNSVFLFLQAAFLKTQCSQWTFYEIFQQKSCLKCMMNSIRYLKKHKKMCEYSAVYFNFQPECWRKRIAFWRCRYNISHKNNQEKCWMNFW